MMLMSMLKTSADTKESEYLEDVDVRRTSLHEGLYTVECRLQIFVRVTGRMNEKSNSAGEGS